MPPYIAPEVHAAVGYWGLPSSTLDWCEENHAWSPYVAEFCMYDLYPVGGGGGANLLLPHKLYVCAYCLYLVLALLLNDREYSQ